MIDRRTKLLPLIATFKILKACLLFTVALGLHHLRVGNAETIILEWMRAVHVEPDNRIAHGILSKITGISPAQLHELGIGTFFYGLIFATEGVGLLLKQRWAEYMTVISTLAFLPVEIYELIARPGRKELKALVLVANVAIMIYLVVNLRKAKRIEPPSGA